MGRRALVFLVKASPYFDSCNRSQRDFYDMQHLECPFPGKPIDGRLPGVGSVPQVARLALSPHSTLDSRLPIEISARSCAKSIKMITTTQTHVEAAEATLLPCRGLRHHIEWLRLIRGRGGVGGVDYICPLKIIKISTAHEAPKTDINHKRAAKKGCDFGKRFFFSLPVLVLSTRPPRSYPGKKTTLSL